MTSAAHHPALARIVPHHLLHMLMQFCGMFCMIARHCSGTLSIIWPIGMPAGG
jgi:hypothetical protein